MLKKMRIGKTTLMLLSVEDAIQYIHEMLVKNIYFNKGVPSHA